MASAKKDPNEGQDFGQCLRCGGRLYLMGVYSFRVGGTSGGWKMLFGELAELDEEMIDLAVLACPTCRKVELRVPVAG